MNGTITREKRRCSLIYIYIIGILLRVCIVDRLPVYIMGSSPHDDGWIVSRANSLLSGHWLGPYDQYTLIKGAFSPVLLAVSKILGITFMHLNTILYCAACLFFLTAIAPIVQNRFSKLACFLVLLFNPISFALETWQRVYRNGFSQWQLLFIFGGMIAIFIRRTETVSQLLPWSVITGFVLWGFCNTREDSIWLMPFVFIAMVITLRTSLSDYKNRRDVKLGDYIKRALLIALPIIILLLGNVGLRLVNYSYYGSAIINDRTGGNYAKVVKDLYLIERDQEDIERFSTEEYQNQYLNITTNTLEKAYSASPTLASARESINLAITIWDSGEIIVDGEPYLDHILFALRDGIAAAGYYKNLPETEQFYQTVHNELNEAFKSGRLKKTGLVLSAGAAPIKTTDIVPLLQEFVATTKYALLFQGVSADVVPVNERDDAVALFENIAGGDMVYSANMITELQGWAFLYENGAQLEILGYASNEEDWTKARFVDSPDVYDYFSSNGLDYTNASFARFVLELQDANTIEDGVLRFYDNNGNMLEECPLNAIIPGQGCFKESFCYLIDDISIKNSLSGMEYDNAQKNVDRVNIISEAYKKVGKWVAVVALIAYMFNSIIVYKKRKRPEDNVLAAWLLQTGILLSILVFLLCISYMTVSTFFARVYLYLSPVYVLMLAFYGVSISTAFETYVMLRKSGPQR